MGSHLVIDGPSLITGGSGQQQPDRVRRFGVLMGSTETELGEQLEWTALNDQPETFSTDATRLPLQTLRRGVQMNCARNTAGGRWWRTRWPPTDHNAAIPPNLASAPSASSASPSRRNSKGSPGRQEAQMRTAERDVQTIRTKVDAIHEVIVEHRSFRPAIRSIGHVVLVMCSGLGVA